MCAVMSEIRLQNVSITLLERPVLRDVTAEITQRRVAVVGRNGSGKTSLIRAMSGLISGSGTITLNGIAATAPRSELLGQVGLLFQNSDHQIIFPTVEEEIAFGLKGKGMTRDQAAVRVKDVLREFGREDWRSRSVSTLSGGQKQLLCIMSLVAINPKIWLLDEPFTGLDLPVRHAIERIFDSLDAQIVHVTHDPQSVAHYDRVIWMQDGQIAADGPPSDILPRYQETMREISDAFTDN